MIQRLSEIQPGNKVLVHSIENDELYLKLMEMGFVPGEEVFVEQLAPFGDPISVTVSNYRLSLRKDEAQVILVQVIDNQIILKD